MDPDGASAAISALDGTELGGRNLRVDQAREREKTRGPRRQRAAW
jgi:RNA recognition motif-containing protein